MKKLTIAFFACAALTTTLACLASTSGSPAVASSSTPTAMHGPSAQPGVPLMGCPQCCPPEICGANGPSLDGAAECDADDASAE